MAVTTYTKTGSKSTASAALPKSVFSEDVKSHDLIKSAYESYLANRRTNPAKVLTRSNVRGGGRKPWKQKGTGRARHGSIRSPIWRGGGITFGPTGNENYAKKLPKKAMRKALRQALTLAAKDNKVSIIEALEAKDGKTKSIANLLDKMSMSRRILAVVDDKAESVVRATKNIQNLKLVQAGYLNVFDIVNADNIIISKKALPVIEKWLGGEK